MSDDISKRTEFTWHDSQQHHDHSWPDPRPNGELVSPSCQMLPFSFPQWLKTTTVEPSPQWWLFHHVLQRVWLDPDAWARWRRPPGSIFHKPCTEDGLARQLSDAKILATCIALLNCLSGWGPFLYRCCIRAWLELLLSASSRHSN